MLITRLYLRNYRVYEDPVDLELPGGLIGIVGANGAGKSYLIESIPWTLFGRTRTSKDDVRTTGVNGDCITEVEFEHEGHVYVVRRTLTGINNTVKVEVHADGLQVATSVREVQRYMHSVLGMDDVAFRSSVFAEQKQLAAFSTNRPAERRDLVLKLLGITPLDVARDLARKDANAKRTLVERTRSVLIDVDAAKTAHADAVAKAGADAAQAAQATALADQAGSAHDTAQAKVDELDGVQREHDAITAEGKTIRAAHDTAKAGAERLTAELAELSGAGAELERLRPLAHQLEPAQLELQHVQAVVTAANRLASLPETEAPPDPDDDGAQALADAASAAAARAAELEGRLAGAREALARATEVASRTAELSGDADCPLCGQALGAAFEQVQTHRQAEVASAQQSVAELESAWETARAEGAAATKAAAAAAVALKQARAALAEHQKASAARTAAAETHAAAVAQLGRPATDADLAEVTARVKTATEAAQACQRLEGRLERRAVAEAELVRQQSITADTEGQLVVLREKLKALGYDRVARDEAIIARNDARDRARQTSTAAERARLEANTSAAVAEQQAKNVAQAEAQHAMVATEAEESRHLSRMSDLLQAFRNAVVATVGPRLSAQAADLFAELTDHEYDTLEVDPETYEIRISDAGRPYGMGRFSGSETDLANLALRVAISEHVRFQSGGAVGLLVLDEVFGPLDNDRKDRMLQALERLKGRFRQVMVVTHENEIKEQLPNVLEVVKLPGRRASAHLLSR
ncbi:MAG: repair protein SbcC/Rad50 [Actinomycetota bacterium]|nr:repair protein SbcC/Rad50 [Actinomycetota bacterium]